MSRAEVAGRMFREAVRVRRKYGFRETPRTMADYQALMDTRRPQDRRRWMDILTPNDREKLRTSIHWFELSQMPKGLPWSVAAEVPLIKSERKRIGMLYPEIVDGHQVWRTAPDSKFEIGPDGDWRMVP